MKKVLIVYGGAKNRGGIYTYLEGIFSSSKNDKEIKLSLATIGNWPLGTSLEKDGFEVWVASKNPSGLLSGIKKAREYDSTVTMGLVSNFFGRFWALLTHKPVITVVHSVCRTDYLSSPIKKFIFAAVERLMRFVTKRYICVSKYLERELVKEGVAAEKITVIYNGVVEHKLKTQNEKHKTPGPVAIVSVGRLHPVKNFNNLIKACADLPKDNWSLTIYGEGVERGSLEATIAELNLKSKVHLPGQVDNLEEKLSRADVYVQSSLSEGFGLAVVEAMQDGLPAVVTPGGALPELVVDGQTGIVATGFGHEEIAVALNKMISDAEKMQKMAQEGQKFVADNFGIEKWAKSTLEVYKKAAK